jgi:hypothetical protein
MSKAPSRYFRYFFVLLTFFYLLITNAILASGQVPAPPSDLVAIELPLPPVFFGLDVNQITTPWPLLPFGSYRFWDDGVRWDEVNTAPGTFNWTVLDAWASKLAQHGVKDTLYELSATPVWASPDPTDMSCDYADEGFPGSCYAPDDLKVDGMGSNAIWRAWVAAVGTHLKSSPVHVVAWGIWNEFTRQPNTGARPIAWKGTNLQMVRMAEDARCILTGRGSITTTGESCKQVLASVGRRWPIDTTTVVLTPSAGWDSTVIAANWTSYYTTPGGSRAAEAFALHDYTSSAELEVGLAKDFRNHLSTSDQKKPLWVTEGAWAPGTITDPQLQADFLTQTYKGFAQLGIARFYWYSYDNIYWGTLWTEGGGLTHAGMAYAAAFKNMTGR